MLASLTLRVLWWFRLSQSALRRWYPEMPPIRPDQADSLAGVPLPRYPSTFTTTCDALHVGDAVVLLGDSGHSCLNGLGQGCNVALESCRVFDGVLREHKGNLETALPAFSVRRCCYSPLPRLRCSPKCEAP